MSENISKPNISNALCLTFSTANDLFVFIYRAIQPSSGYTVVLQMIHLEIHIKKNISKNIKKENIKLKSQKPKYLFCVFNNLYVCL